VTPEILHLDGLDQNAVWADWIRTIRQAFIDSPQVRYADSEQTWWRDLVGPCCSPPPSLVAFQCARSIMVTAQGFYQCQPLRVESIFIASLAAGGKIVPHADSEAVIGGKWAPNHTANRTYSAVLYLNSEFEGGELDFPGLKRRFQPRRGTLIAWPADHRFVHQVLPVKGGVRISMPVWFEPERSENRGF